MSIALLRAAGSAAQMGRRRASAGGGVAPTITVAPVLTWTVEIGTSPAITPPTYTGDAGTIAYTLKREGVNVSGMVGVSEATLEAYAAVAADTIAQSSGMTVEATVTNGSGSDSDTSNAEKYDPSRTTTARLWWDVDSLGAGGVSSWTDEIASIAATQADSAKRPTKSATAIGGSYPGVTGDGGDVLAADLSLLSGKTVMAVTWVMGDGTTSACIPWELSTNVTAQNGSVAANVNSVAGTLAAYARGTAGFSYKYFTQSLTTPVVVTMIFDLSVSGAGCVVAIRINGVAQTLTTGGSASTALSFGAHTLYIWGRSVGPAFGWPGTGGDMVWRESSAQDSALESVERYVGAKAGITW